MGKSWENDGNLHGICQVGFHGCHGMICRLGFVLPTGFSLPHTHHGVGVTELGVESA